VIYFGAANSGGVGKTAIYTPPASPTLQGTWIAGPDIPKVGGQTIVSNDCPASLLPNGTVLFTGANFVNGNWGQPILFFEYDPVANTITQAPTPPNNNEQLFWSRLMLLPTGQVLFGPSTNNMQVYTASGHPHHSWRPHITSVHRSSAHRYTLHGKQLNGLSQANIYGDDCYPATNYPLVRLRNVHNHHVYFARTSHFSTMAVATGASNQACRFTVGNIPHGEYEIVVIANGIESAPVRLHHRPRRHDEDERFRRDEELVEVNIEVNGRGEAELDPALAELSSQIKLLQNSVRRLNLMTESKAARREPKIAKAEQADAVAAEKPKVRKMAS
jgi:hypothetical protein